MVLGLDISTSRVGFAVIEMDGTLVSYNNIKYRADALLEQRADYLIAGISKLKKEFGVKYVYVEQPFIAFSGGKTTAHTMAKLQRFNGMCCYGLYCLYGTAPTLIQANKARGLCGIKIKRGEKAKEKVIAWAKETYPDSFDYELTRYGNPKPGTDDMADAIVVANAGLKIFNEERLDNTK
jgi:hypothetical protein